MKKPLVEVISDLQKDLKSNADANLGYSLHELINDFKPGVRNALIRHVMHVMASLNGESFTLVIEAAFNCQTPSNAKILIKLLEEAKNEVV